MLNELLGKAVHSSLTQPYCMFKYYIHVGRCVWCCLGHCKVVIKEWFQNGRAVHTWDTLIRSLKHHSFCITSKNSGSHIQELCWYKVKVKVSQLKKKVVELWVPFLLSYQILLNNTACQFCSSIHPESWKHFTIFPPHALLFKAILAGLGLFLSLQ